MRWSEDQYRAYVTRGQPAPVSEKAWQGTIAQLARQYNWLYYHTFDSRRSPSGFPDVVLDKVGQPLYCVELKSNTGQVTLAQEAWLTALGACTGVVAEIWLPKDLEEICRQLRG